MLSSSRQITSRASRSCNKNVLRSQSCAFSAYPILHSKLKIGDRVILRWVQAKKDHRKLTSPLRVDGETTVGDHRIKHKHLIDQQSGIRLVSTSKVGRVLSINAQHPSLDEFTSLAPRRVAPIYSTYCDTIVSLLDLHSDAGNSNICTDQSIPGLQILEAGTGHGSLTLALARAVAAANPALNDAIKPAVSSKTVYKAGDEVGDNSTEESAELREWRKQRRAIVHTVEIDPQNRQHADSLIRSFRNALYWPHIDFHVGDVKDWVAQKLSEHADGSFLDVAILDMPGVEEYVEPVVDAIKDRGMLLVFVPQITQIATCVQEIVSKNLHLKLERVVELGDGISTGRSWDVRLAHLKHTKASKFADRSDDPENEDTAPVVAAPKVGTIPPMVCRPIVGEMTRGGGFIGLWKKISQEKDEPILVQQ